MSNTLVNLKVCIPEFNSEALLDDGVKIERCWRQWLENFECCISFEGVTDQSNSLSKKKLPFLPSVARNLGAVLYSHTTSRHVRSSYDHFTNTFHIEKELNC